MRKYILKRILMVIPVLLGVSFIVFTLMYIAPGDAATSILGDMATESDIELFREQNGLNEPFLIQYFNYIKNIVTKGDFGTSYTSKQPVTDEILQRFPTTFQLAAISIVIASIVGVLLGLLAALRQNSIFDNICSFISVLGVSIPNFWQGMMMIILFAVVLKWLPPSGFSTPANWVLPTITLGTSAAASIMRMTRSSVLEVKNQDYIRTARAKGVRKNGIVFLHILKNAAVPILTVIGTSFGKMLSGAVMVETVFSIPGIGKLMVDAITYKNTPMVLGCILFIAIILVLLNLIIDLLYALIDPRIRVQYGSRKNV